ncbi:unnamed protein product [Sphenostylis stenocarpa]|uniref:Uncharacterized protein n=1 Tax=Sphenostylis stenocarpa TaxID=92480 RepID=A0AA86S8I1_9FABA|nr:unnamed protein product [Sphenostylis stenocarpa]
MIKVDKLQLIELCGVHLNLSFLVPATMKDLCHDVFGVAKEKKDAREVQSNRDALCIKRFFPRFVKIYLMPCQIRGKLRKEVICNWTDSDEDIPLMEQKLASQEEIKEGKESAYNVKLCEKENWKCLSCKDTFSGAYFAKLDKQSLKKWGQ